LKCHRQPRPRVATCTPSPPFSPGLSNEVLSEMEEDIAENGLIHAVVLDSDGAVVDGISREAACKIAGIEPRYESLPARWGCPEIVDTGLCGLLPAGQG
jgi:ParB-like chromosome segregation protein Spo0J